jgi:hypothetical protein
MLISYFRSSLSPHSPLCSLALLLDDDDDTDYTELSSYGKLFGNDFNVLYLDFGLDVMYLKFN